MSDQIGQIKGTCLYWMGSEPAVRRDPRILGMHVRAHSDGSKSQIIV